MAKKDTRPRRRIKQRSKMPPELVALSQSPLYKAIFGEPPTPEQIMDKYHIVPGLYTEEQVQVLTDAALQDRELMSEEISRWLNNPNFMEKIRALWEDKSESS